MRVIGLDIHRVFAEAMTLEAGRLETLIAHLMVYPVPVEGGRCLVETHGNVGAIYFDGEQVDAGNLVPLYGNRGYEKIFPYPMSKICFNGCYIADGGGGWPFLDTVGKVFLRSAGGVVVAQTGALLGWTTLTGHVIHFCADTCYSFMLPGGIVTGHRTD